MLRSFTICNVQLTIKLSPDLGNGGLVWPSTFVLAQYLNSSRTLSGKCIAELGAGTGLLGIWAATQGAHVVLTDVAELVPLLQENARMNMDQISKGGGSIRVEPLLWGETSHVPASVFDCALIVGSDLVHWIAFTLFDDDSRLLLCQTMRRLLGARCDKTVYLCHEVRTKLREAQFLLMVNEAGLLVHEELSTTYAPCLDARGGLRFGCSGSFKGASALATSDVSDVCGDSLCITSQSSTELDCENRDIVVWRISA
jgi:predicted nicotinamide N-methyase